jgi:hypothetical protein
MGAAMVFGVHLLTRTRLSRFERYLPILTISAGMAGAFLYSYFTRS